MKKPFLSGYKTYDTSTGFGSPSSWKKAFSERMGYKEAHERVEKAKDIPFAEQLKSAKTMAELKKIYREAMKKFHPDHGGDTEVARNIIALYTVELERFA